MTEKLIPFSPQDSVMLLIDHQQDTLDFCRNISRSTIVQNTRALARVAQALDMPLVLTTSQEDHAQGPLIPDLREILPEAYEAGIKRSGMANAWHDARYKDAVVQTAGGRTNTIMAGLTNDVCIVYPSISMVGEGFRVQVVQDAGGSPNAIAEDAARQRWTNYGVVTTSTNQLIAELGVDWSTEAGEKLVQITFEEVISHLDAES
ncbi:MULTISPECIES: isochorismatase family protein [unclassified Arthrobacter]|uniref:isochorismatase family protein n=1 Tax=unclassified Arthrobacter TaxID=235627 RepID=UPI002DFC75CD|nr:MULTISPECIES: isochorismatase family protein [unclassified Arthrobacter]MEC5193128.1 nicotinamidase-related amidase [Arthrobacter sp. MP_M4]MEC5204594.1 nicotinamidase-related amidase [Arthrobacter sp. MP_M7]